MKVRFAVIAVLTAIVAILVGTPVEAAAARPSQVVASCWWADQDNIVYTDWNKQGSQAVYDYYGAGEWRTIYFDLWSYRLDSSNGDCYRSYYASVWTGDASGLYAEALIRLWRCGNYVDSFDGGRAWGTRNDVTVPANRGSLTVYTVLPSGQGRNLGYYDYGGTTVPLCNPQADNYQSNGTSPTWNQQAQVYLSF